jgi:hypothetical protein
MVGVGSALRRIYLSVYNWVVFVGWAQVLYYAVLVLRESGHEAVYAAVERPLQFAQTAAIMEVYRFLFLYLPFLLYFHLVVYFSFCCHSKSCELGAIKGFCLAY